MPDTPKSVLIVDDEPQIGLVIGDELSACGFDCRIVSDSQEAKRLLEMERYDVLIADVVMPHVSGLDLLACVRQRAPHCKAILITGMSNREYLAQALMLGAFDYIEKPFDMGDLIEMVRSATGSGPGIPQLPLRAALAMEEVATHREAQPWVSPSDQARKAALDSVRALARAIEAKSPYTRRHSEHVTHYATLLAKALGAPEDLVESVRTAALLHDIGKIGVPDHILTKPGKLTDDEFDFVRRHPGLGADILANITLFGPETRVVRHHHENWDGSGYPDGLIGEEIPWAARVIRVADAMDAMLMDRPYKGGFPIETMVGELRQCSGRQFDPQIVAVAVAWCRENPDKLILPNRPIEAVTQV